MLQLLMIQPVLHMVVIVLSLVLTVSTMISCSTVVFQILVILNNDIMSIMQQGHQLWLIHAAIANSIYCYICLQ